MKPFIINAGLTLLILMFSMRVGGQQENPDRDDIARGEKEFTRIENSGGKTCLDCHYMTEPDTINWNPSAPDLGSRSGVYQEEGLVQYFTKPDGDVMKTAHEGISLSSDQEASLTAYIASLEETRVAFREPVRWKMILFFGMFVLLVLLRMEKRRLKKIPSMVRWMVVPLVWTVILFIAFQDAVGFNRSRNYAPVQPVKFSHSIHYTDNQIDCNYCHSGVLKGKNAGIPPVSLCMNCHKHQQEGTRTGKFELRKVIQAAEDSVPIHWVRIHNLPDFTYFNHMQHVTVGGVDCITCHGDVENMHIVKQVEDLSMGWCIDCHDETAVDFSNDYYKLYYPLLLDSLQTGKIDSIMVSDIGGRECGKCHY